MAKRGSGRGRGKAPEQLPLPLAERVLPPDPDPDPDRDPDREPTSGPGPLRAIAGGGEGPGHPRARLVAVDGGRPQHAACRSGAGGALPKRPLPTRDELNRVLLQALADLVAGRITPDAAGEVRKAAEAALVSLERAEHDPAHLPAFVRAARALDELVRYPAGA